MADYKLTEKKIEKFQDYLWNEEHACSTVEKYVRNSKDNFHGQEKKGWNLVLQITQNGKMENIS